MSSSGIISNAKLPTTLHGEVQRQTDGAISAFPGIGEGSRQATGIIKKIHPDRPRLIKAYADDGTPLANDSWIELNHSAQEIAERWGTVRLGFRVRVTFAGPSGAGADATIIGAEQESVSEPHIPNEAARGLFAIFAPGIGVG